jgi:segregation and condensation protein B
MELDRIEAAIEAILFTMGESVEVSKLAAAVEHDTDTTRKIVHNMMDKYEASDRGIKIIELEDAFQMCTKQEYYDTLIKVASQPRKYSLTDTILETLSIIAYKQPVTKMEIEKIRGVSSDHAVNKLVEYGLVKELGRLDAPGRPMLFGTSEEFLRVFGVQSIEELPVISEDLIERFKDEAEMEMEEEQREAENAADSDDEQLMLDI